MSFYKLRHDGVLQAAEGLDGPGWSMHSPDDKPQDGWRWFDSEQEAFDALLPSFTTERLDSLAKLLTPEKQAKLEALLEVDTVALTSIVADASVIAKIPVKGK